MTNAWPELPGYELVRPIAFGASGSVFEARAPGGFVKAVKIIPLNADNPLSRREVDGLELLQAVRHPFLINIDRVDVGEDRIVVVMELADASLFDEFRACQKKGLPGVPRHRLLRLLTEVADALDYLNFRRHIQHLDVKPDNLLLIAGHAKLADFGLARDASRFSVPLSAPAVTPAYAPPELLSRRASSQSDQYSLGVVYVQMLTGRLPFVEGGPWQLVQQKIRQSPFLDAIPAGDLPAVRRALAADPNERFSTSGEFMEALAAASPPGRRSRPDSVEVRMARSAVDVAAATEARAIPSIGGFPLGEPNAALRTSWLVGTEPTMTAEVVRLYAFNRQARILCETSDSTVVRLGVAAAPATGMNSGDAFLIRLHYLGRKGDFGWLIVSCVEHYGRALPDAEFERCSREITAGLKEALSLRPATAARIRLENRRPFDGPVEIVPKAGGFRGMRIRGAGVDISPGGVGLQALIPLGEGKVRLNFAGSKPSVDAHLVRCERRNAHHYHLGFTLNGGVDSAPLLGESEI